jgi:hypothetical protein
MSLYRLDTSIRVQGSHSRAIADIVEQEWRRACPGDPVPGLAAKDRQRLIHACVPRGSPRGWRGRWR